MMRLLVLGLLAISSPGIANSISSGKCPTGWIDASHVGLGCLFYAWEEGRCAADYGSAVIMCQQGPYSEFCPNCGTPTGHLLEILTTEQHEYIKDLLSLTEHDNSINFYTAATDINRGEGRWYWSHSLVDVGDFVWQNGWPQYQQYGMFGTLNKGYEGNEWTMRDVPEYWNSACGSYFPFCQYHPDEVFTTTVESPVQAPACTNYTELSDSWRKIDYSSGAPHVEHCDASWTGFTSQWYRFVGAAGSALPTSPPSGQNMNCFDVCGTCRSAWINGDHPLPSDGEVTRTVCWEWSSSCSESQEIQVAACHDENNDEDYYVYLLDPVPYCAMAYCAL